MIPAGVLGSARVGSTWTPESLGAALVGWWDASDAATITQSGGYVSAWGDKSPSARALTQATSTAQPLTGTRTLNGLNVLDFDGGDWLVNTTLLATVQPFTVATVSQFDATTGTGAFVAYNNGAHTPYAGTDGIWKSSAGTFLTTGVAANTSPHVHAYIFNGASTQLRIDGAQVALGNAGTNGTGATVAGAVTTAGGSPLNGALGECLIASGALSGADLANLETYLKTKWGIA